MNIRFKGYFTWMLYPRDFVGVSQASYTIESFTVKEVLETTGDGPEILKGVSIVCKGILLPKTKEEVGVLFELEGEYGTDSKGRASIDVKRCYPALPSNRDETIKFLSCGIIKGVGKTTATKIYDAFGSDAIRIIEFEHEKLSTVNGISKAKAEQIYKNYMERGSDVKVFVDRLRNFSIPEEVAVKAYDVLGAKRVELIDQSIYHLCNRKLLSFNQVELLAKKFPDKYNPYDPVRIEKAILSVLYQNETGGGPLFPNGGNLYCPFNLAVDNVLKLLGNMNGDRTCIYDALSKLNSAGKIYWEVQTNVLYRKATFEAEDEAARLVANQLKKPALKVKDLDFELERECLAKGIQLGDEQKDAVLMALQQPFSVITGFPGTGKTTIQKMILSLLKRVYKQDAVLLAPTGRASKRMNESTEHEARTIHSALGLESDLEEIRSYSEPRIKTALLIVDEASMMDIFVFRALMKYTEAARICIIGDIDQLPSVGCGCVLKDLIETPLVSLTRLTRIYRQAKINGIIENAMYIRGGKYKWRLDEAFEFHEMPDQVIPQTVCADYEDCVKKYGQENVVLLTPYRKNGILSTNALNKDLQARLNPNRGQKAFERRKNSGEYFFVGDPVQLLHNMPEKGVVNGDVGKMVDSDGDNLTVDFDGTVVEFTREESHFLDLAYATTIHKSQGSEYKVVLMILSESQKIILKRNLVYGLTRSKDVCKCYGQEKAMIIAIANQDTYQRASMLSERIRMALVTPIKVKKEKKPAYVE